MEVTLNGSPFALKAPLSVGELVHQQNLPERGVAVAVNREVVRRSRWNETLLKPGDAVEIIQAVQGG